MSIKLLHVIDSSPVLNLLSLLHVIHTMYTIVQEIQTESVISLGVLVALYPVFSSQMNPGNSNLEKNENTCVLVFSQV